MGWLNTTQGFGVVSVVLHWLAALLVCGLFGLGVWMVELGYYDVWYHRAPALHKSVGMILLAIALFRLGWSRFTPPPASLGPPGERAVAAMVHHFMSLLVLMIVASGYLIATAGGLSVQVFDWFSVAALPLDFKHQADTAGAVHAWLAYALMAIVLLHIIAALKHHFLDRDRTLLRMLVSGGDR